jgi:hypothetical protein
MHLTRTCASEQRRWSTDGADGRSAVGTPTSWTTASENRKLVLEQRGWVEGARPLLGEKCQKSDCSFSVRRADLTKRATESISRLYASPVCPARHTACPPVRCRRWRSPPVLGRSPPRRHSAAYARCDARRCRGTLAHSGLGRIRRRC